MASNMENFNSYQGISATRKLIIVGLSVILVVAFGTVGFITLENMNPIDALYMTIITLSTVGFGEVSPLHPHGRLFVVILIVFGVVIAASLARVLAEQVLEGHFTHLVARRKMESRLKRMRDHYIIAGFGRVGRQVVQDFLAQNVPFVVIEKEENLTDATLGSKVLFLHGNATEDDVLIRAGIDRAKTLISTLPDEAQNVYLTLTARHMNPDLKIIARADYEEGEKKLLRAGANHVVIPHVIGGIRMAKAALQPHVVDFMHMASVGNEGLMVEEMVVPADCRLTGKTLAESGLKQDYGVTIIGVKKQNAKMDINPGPSTVLAPADVLVVVGKTDSLLRLGQDLDR